MAPGEAENTMLAIFRGRKKVSARKLFRIKVQLQMGLTLQCIYRIGAGQMGLRQYGSHRMSFEEFLPKAVRAKLQPIGGLPDIITRFLHFPSPFFPRLDGKD